MGVSLLNGNELLDYNGLKHFYAKLKTDPSFIKNGGSNIPAGLIAMWSGTEVPEGWALCNGENDTPDLSDKFVVGTTSLEDNGETITLTEAGSLFTAGEEISFYKLAFIMKIGNEETNSGVGPTYTPGDGIQIEDNVISIKNPVQGIITIENYESLSDDEKNKGVWFVIDDKTSVSANSQSLESSSFGSHLTGSLDVEHDKSI